MFDEKHIYTEEDVKASLNKIRKRLNDLRDSLVDYESKMKSLELQVSQSKLQPRRSIGVQPCNSNHVPLILHGTDIIDVEKSLAKMFNIANGNYRYNLATNNCATSVSMVLEECLIDPSLQYIASKRNFFGIIYPRFLMENVSQINTQIYSGKHRSLWRGLYKLNPIYWIKLAIIIPLGIIFNPASNFLLKTAAVFCVALISIPLFLSIIIFTPFVIMGNYIFKSSKPNYFDVKLSEVGLPLDPKEYKDLESNYNMESENHKIASAFLNSKIYEIDNYDKKNALLQYITALYTTDSIPCFSQKIKATLLLELSSDANDSDGVIDYILQKIVELRGQPADTLLPPFSMPNLRDKRNELINDPKRIVEELETLSLIKLKDISKILYKKISSNAENISTAGATMNSKSQSLIDKTEIDMKAEKNSIQKKDDKDRFGL